MATSVELSPETESRLRQLAERTGQSTAVVLDRLVAEHLDDLADAYLAEEAWAEHVASGETTISLEQLEKELGLEG